MTEIYQNRIDEMFNRITNNQYIIEMTKCCGYCFFMLFHKNFTLSDMYNHVLFEMPSNTIKLYLQKETGERLIIPRDSTIILRTFILENSEWFKPIYPMPVKVVYRVYFDDGHTHECDNVMNNVNDDTYANNVNANNINANNANNANNDNANNDNANNDNANNDNANNDNANNDNANNVNANNVNANNVNEIQMNIEY
jgi:hypothetical protein